MPWNEQDGVEKPGHLKTTTRSFSLRQRFWNGPSRVFSGHSCSGRTGSFWWVTFSHVYFWTPCMDCSGLEVSKWKCAAVLYVLIVLICISQRWEAFRDDPAAVLH